MEESFIRDLLSKAGIDINGKNPWDITVYDKRFYRRVLTNAELAFGETYLDRWWDCEKLDTLIEKILKADLETKALSDPKFWLSMINQIFFDFTYRYFNFQTKHKSLIVGRKHYDVGNDLFEAMLDKRMVYTCGYWDNVNNLDEAQEKKLELCCQKLNLQPGMTVLDIGCGWGSFGKYAAEKYGVSVVGVTISKEQVELGQKLCSGLPVKIQFLDYRDLLKSTMQYDRVISLGMFEHVGHKNYPIFMQTAAHCLKDDGIFLLHTIGANTSHRSTSSWINTYIFPHGHIPSIKEIATAFENVFVMEDWQNFGVYYDKTLMTWCENFNQHWDKLKHQYPERFRRMWNYYLLSCAGSFRARHNQLWQIVLTKKGLSRGYPYGNILRPLKNLPSD